MVNICILVQVERSVKNISLLRDTGIAIMPTYTEWRWLGAIFGREKLSDLENNKENKYALI